MVLSHTQKDECVPGEGVKVDGGDVKHLLVPHESDVLQVRLEGPHRLLLKVVVLAEDNLHFDIDALQLGRVNTVREKDYAVLILKLPIELHDGTITSLRQTHRQDKNSLEEILTEESLLLT